ncbi:hypothetical protein BJV82DRAFT_612200 [Fennellomyces sp. T-0311]|nr:hypothetical protein BJV82DRAFT_612200 [Fennellomyces sp. T-0311]
MQPSKDEDSDEDSDSSEEDETSVASVDAEERAYLMEIQQQDRRRTASRSSSTSFRPPLSPTLSRTSAHSAARYIRTNNSSRTQMRTPSAASSVQGRRLSQVSIPGRKRPPPPPPPPNKLGSGIFVEPAATEPFDPHVNPWAQQPSARQYKVDDGSVNEVENQPSMVQLPSPVISATSAHATLSPAQRHVQSPSSAASSMTATGPPPQARIGSAESSLLTDQQYTSVVALGPATKRALDTLQAEILALNERIDGLRQELVERDRRRPVDVEEEEADDGNERWDGWKWVVKAAVKHAAINLLMATLLFLALYKQQSPVAYMILGQITKYWRRTRLRLTISKILV